MSYKKLKALFLLISIFSSSLLSSDIYSKTGPDYDKIPRNALSDAAISIGSPYHLKLIAAGLGDISGAARSQKILWGLLFTSPDKITLNQAKPMANAIAISLLEKIYKDPSFANYHKKESEGFPKHPPTFLSDKDLAFRIDFWDENVDRPLYPHIAQIRFIDDTLYYYYADPKTQGLQDPFLVEPLSPSKSASL